jgi:hypothetical protein
VSISGTWAAISAFHYEGTTLRFNGIVYMYQRNNNGNWVQQAKLTNPAADTAGRFGYSTDMDGDHLIVGAPNNKDDEGIRSGRVYLYQRSGTAWNLQASFIRPGGQAGDHFGYDVTLDVTASGIVRAAAGAPNASGFQGPNQGYVRMFKKPVGGTWQIDQDLVFLHSRADEWAGYSIDMEEDRLVAGAPNAGYTFNNSIVYANAGVVYLFRLGADGLWNPEERWVHATPKYYFGYSVSISNSRIAIGAPNFGPNTKASPSVYIYYLRNNQWQSMHLYPPYDLTTGVGNTYFGISVGLSGNNLVIGASGGDELLLITQNGLHTGQRPGLAVLYQLRNINGGPNFEVVRRNTFQSEVEHIYNYFGMTVAVSGGNYILSDHNRNSSTRYKAGMVQFGSVE